MTKVRDRFGVSDKDVCQTALIIASLTQGFRVSLLHSESRWFESIKEHKNACIAQLVERVICNLEVVGSIPTIGSFLFGSLVQLVRTLPPLG